MTRAVCRSNWDAFKGKAWPDTFARVPEKGDMVQEKAPLGHRGLIAKVVEVTHCQDGAGPWLFIELHLPYSGSPSGGSDR
jgi:hypothetical protein